jgi:phosphatidylethanolamine-binding protein (PEBP) family uncharacterized protein
MSLELSSTAFAHCGEIPSEFTCEARDISPPLEASMRGHVVAQAEPVGTYQRCK